jgi:Domain of unknown function DUF11
VLASAVVLVAACTGAAVAAVSHSSAPPRVRSDQRVVICHGTGNGKWVRLAPSVDGVLNGHAGHPDDIIPPFDYTLANGTTGSFPGLNWDAEGQAIYENGCVRPNPHPEPITVSTTCVDVHGSTYDATFGYQSDNAVDVHVPLGAANGFAPPPLVRGQVTVFQPGSVATAFSVTDIAVNTELTWTVTYAGQTSAATATSAFPQHCTPPRPPRVGIFVRCVTNHANTFDATFGYQNDGPAAVTIPVGAGNRFLPAPADRGQTTNFSPGNVQKAFTVTGIPEGSDLVWTVTSNATRIATASASDETKCSEPPPPISPIGVFVTCVRNHDSTYDAVFGYQNDNVVAEHVPIGEGNAFSPAPANRGQPTLFLPQRVLDAVRVNGIPSSVALTWTLAFDGTRSAVATASFALKCPDTPKPPDPPGPRPPDPPRPLGIFATCVFNHGRTYDATFGYVNENVGDVVVPIGLNNNVLPGRINRGQPATFRPGIVPASFTAHAVRFKRAVRWRVAFADEVRVATAYATLERKCKTTPIGLGDLAVKKLVKPRVAVVGDRVVFTIVGKNTGSRTIKPVVIADSFRDRRLAILSVASTQGSCRTVTRTRSHGIRCNGRALAPGERFTVKVATRAVKPGHSTDRVVIVGLARDPTRKNNLDSATVVIHGRARPSPRPRNTG